jgi:hypothetical protein
MIKRLLNEHVQHIVLLVLEHQGDQAPEQIHLTYLLEDPFARNRNAVTEHLNKRANTYSSL